MDLDTRLLAGGGILSACVVYLSLPLFMDVGEKPKPAGPVNYIGGQYKVCRTVMYPVGEYSQMECPHYYHKLTIENNHYVCTCSEKEQVVR